MLALAMEGRQGVGLAGKVGWAAAPPTSGSSSSPSQAAFLGLFPSQPSSFSAVRRRCKDPNLRLHSLHQACHARGLLEATPPLGFSWPAGAPTSPLAVAYSPTLSLFLTLTLASAVPR